jgi:hypothetical protein
LAFTRFSLITIAKIATSDCQEILTNLTVNLLGKILYFPGQNLEPQGANSALGGSDAKVLVDFVDLLLTASLGANRIHAQRGLESINPKHSLVSG